MFSFYDTSKPFSVEDVPDMTGKVCIVTGANTGLGSMCAKVLAKKGAHVFLACRTASKADPIIAEIKAETGNDKVEFLALDLLSLSSVTSCIETFKARNLPLHLLLNNAGVMNSPFSLSPDGLESQFATNHVGHFYLTTQLLPILEASAPSRIVQVTSNGHAFSRGLKLDTLNDPKSYNGWTAYGRSKLSNILFAKELTKKLEAKGIKLQLHKLNPVARNLWLFIPSQNIYVNAAHPGPARSEIARHTLTGYFSFLNNILYYIGIPLEVGAATQMYLATSSEVEEKDIRGQYYVPVAKPGVPTVYARDDALAEELWTWTENTLKEKVPGYPGSTI